MRNVLCALRTAVENLFGDEAMVSSEVSVPGFLTLEDGRSAQVFVKVAIFDDNLLIEDPETGGLLENRRGDGE